MGVRLHVVLIRPITKEATSQTRRDRLWDWLPCEWMSPFTKEATSKTRPHYDSLLPATLPDPSSGSPCPPLFGLEAWGGVYGLAADGLGCGVIPGPRGPFVEPLECLLPLSPSFFVPCPLK